MKQELFVISNKMRVVLTILIIGLCVFFFSFIQKQVHSFVSTFHNSANGSLASSDWETRSCDQPYSYSEELRPVNENKSLFISCAGFFE